MNSDNGFTSDSVRSLIYLLCSGNILTKVTDFDNDEIFADRPLIGFSTQMHNDINNDFKDDKYYVYLNINSIYEVTKLSIKAFEVNSLEEIFNKIKEYFTQHCSIYRFNNIAVFYKIDIDLGLYRMMKDYYSKEAEK